jgi:hypothetical protein
MLMCLVLILASGTLTVFCANTDWKAFLGFAFMCVVALLLTSHKKQMRGLVSPAPVETKYHFAVFQALTGPRSHRTFEGAKEASENGRSCYPFKTFEDFKLFWVWAASNDDAVTYSKQATDLDELTYASALKWFKRAFKEHEYYREGACIEFESRRIPPTAEAHHAATEGEDWLKPYVKRALVAVLSMVTPYLGFKGLEEIPYYLPWDYVKWPWWTNVFMSLLTGLVTVVYATAWAYYISSDETVTAFCQDVLPRLLRWKK